MHIVYGLLKIQSGAVGRKPGTWGYGLERGMKVSCSKTEYVCANEREVGGTARLQ